MELSKRYSASIVNGLLISGLAAVLPEFNDAFAPGTTGRSSDLTRNLLQIASGTPGRSAILIS